MSSERQVTLEIERFDPAVDPEPYVETFVVPYDDTTSLLDAVIRIRNEMDPTLVIRYACRGANACRQCLASVNGRTAYLCTVAVHTLLDSHPGPVRLAPMPGRPRERDLLVDLELD